MNAKDLKELSNFLEKVPSIKILSSGYYNDGNWWLKLNIDLDNKLSWSVVQELGHILNYLSVEEKLPTIFYPVSPPPYMNGGPKDFLSWIIESKDNKFSHLDALEWLKGRLPNPVNDLKQWNQN